MSRLWDKGLPLDDRILRFTAGEDYMLDARLVPYDVRASIAHARMLQARSLLSEQDCEAIVSGLEELATEHAADKWSITLEDEDVHGALESRLRERIGEAGGRVHLGRSRNDQVLAALRLYLRDAVASLSSQTGAAVKALDVIAADQGQIELPGYTHMQPAMPSSVALWAPDWNARWRAST
jgi:argininosuccinate lyase